MSPDQVHELRQIESLLEAALLRLDPFTRLRSEFSVAMTRTKEAHFWVSEGAELLLKLGPER